MKSIELLMAGVGDCIAATGIISYLKSINGEIQVYGGGLSDLLHLENVKVIDARPRLCKQLHTDYTLSIEPNTGYTHFKQHLSYHFSDQVGIPRGIRRPHLTTCLSTSFVLNAYSLPYKQYIVITRLAGWAPRIPGKEDMDWVIGYLKQKTGLPVVEVGVNRDVSQTSSHTDINLLAKTSLRSLYHILDGAKYIFTLDSMVYHLAMERHLRTPTLVWWGNIRPELRAYPGSFDYHSGLCSDCGDKDLMTVPRYCFNGTEACLTLVKDKMAAVIDDMTSHYPRYLNQGNAKSFVEDIASEYCRGRGIDIGAGRFPFQDAIPIDNDTQINANNLKRFVDKSVDYVFSSHCLEHLDAWKEALREWIRVLKKGGILFLYLPHESMVQWHPNSPWVGSDHRWIPVWQRVSDYLVHNGMVILDIDPGPDRYFSFWGVFRKS
ncbi:MAG: methyltransferase domain-containing protein [Syntrophobacteraceae bacterium]